ncbi:MAG: LPS assembly lipoprotein LptE [Ignavibacteriae bacterium]|nr:LPS assembly lipoprotein LptE [Ignavibacteriota bacterium]
MLSRLQMTDYRLQCTTIFSCVLLSVFCIQISGCAYSFSGASVPPHLKTIAIPIVDDQSGYGDPALRQQFTTELVNRFLSDNTLELTDAAGADAILKGVIVSVNEAASVVAAGEQVTQRRLTVTVRMTFQDIKQRKTVWEKNFSNWGDFASGGGATQRSVGLEEAIRKLTEDILNDTVSGW